MINLDGMMVRTQEKLNLVPSVANVTQYFILRLKFELGDGGSLEPVSCQGFKPGKPHPEDSVIPLVDMGSIPIDRLRKAVTATHRHPLLKQLFNQGICVVTDSPMLIPSCMLTVQLWVTNTNWVDAIKPALKSVKNQRHFINYCLMQMPENPINSTAFGYIESTALLGDGNSYAYNVGMNGQAQASTLLNDFIVGNNIGDDPEFKQFMPSTFTFRSFTQEEFDRRIPPVPEEKLREVERAALEAASEAKSASTKSKALLLEKKPLNGKLKKKKLKLRKEAAIEEAVQQAPKKKKKKFKTAVATASEPVYLKKKKKKKLKSKAVEEAPAPKKKKPSLFTAPQSAASAKATSRFKRLRR